MGCATSKSSHPSHKSNESIASATAEPSSKPSGPSHETKSRMTEKERKEAIAAAVHELDVAYDAAVRDASAAEELPGCQWRYMEGHLLEPLMTCTSPIDVRWLVRLAKGEETNDQATGVGVPVPWQKVPTQATSTVSVSSCRKCTRQLILPIIIISYGWASKRHPDPTGEQLQAILPAFEWYAIQCDKEVYKPEGKNYCNFGLGCICGVVWDFMSLPQRGYTIGWSDDVDDRTPMEIARFMRGLKGINEWYGHPAIDVLVCNRPMPASAQNCRQLEDRGWCIFERRLSSLVKQAEAFHQLKNMSGDAKSPDMFDKECRANRDAPITPDKFKEMMLEGVEREKNKPGAGITFTSGKDLTEVVIPQYEIAFLRLMANTWFFGYENIGFSDADGVQIASAFEYASKALPATPSRCTKVWLHGNQLGDEAFKAMLKVFTNGWFPNLEVLVFQNNKIGDDGAKALLEALHSGSTAPWKKLRQFMLDKNLISQSLSNQLKAAMLKAHGVRLQI